MTAGEQIEDGLEDAERVLEGHLAAGAMPELVEGAALEQVHDEERLAVVADVVVGDGHACWVVDGVRDLAFAEEALADLRLPGKLGVQDLDGRARPVAMLRGEHGAHAPDAKQPLELPLRVQRAANASLGRSYGIHAMRRTGLGHQRLMVHRAQGRSPTHHVA